MSESSGSDQHDSESVKDSENQNQDQCPDINLEPDATQDKQADEKVVTKQPKKRKNATTKTEKGDGDEGDDEKLEKEGPTVEVEFTPFSDEGCISAAAGTGSVSKDYNDGLINLELVGPNISCTMSCAEFPTVETECTLEVCSANYLIGAILCTCGLAFDTKLTWTDEGVEAEVLGTGLDTSEGYAISALGSKIGLADIEKRKKKWAKKKRRWNKKKGKVSPEEEGEENGDGDDGEDEGEEEDDDEGSD